MTNEEFTDYLIKEYVSHCMVSTKEAMEVKRIVLVGLISGDLLEKRNAARIIHFFLRYTHLEEDEPDWDKAKILKDLYDCRVCVDHVGQIYVKGIIEPASVDVFGMRDIINSEEAQIIISKVFDKSRRIIP